MYYGSRSIHETWSAGGLPISGVEELIKKAHGRHDSAYDGTDGSEKGNVSLSIVFYDLYVERRNLVEEKYPGKTCRNEFWKNDHESGDRNTQSGWSEKSNNVPRPPPGLTCLRCSVTLYWLVWGVKTQTFVGTHVSD